MGAVALLAATDARSALESSRWRFRRQVPGPFARAEVVSLRLDAKIFDASLPDLSDVRILDRSGSEIGYAVRLENGSPERIRYEPRIYNRTYGPGPSASATLDFGNRAMKDTLVLRTGGESFRRRVRVESSDDGARWGLLRDDAFLLSVPAAGGRDAIDRETIDLPPGDGRYWRVTVFNDPADPPRIEIESAHAERSGTRPPTLEQVPLDILATREEEKEKFTEIRIDTDARNRPLHALRFAFEDASFQRRAVVEGRNEEKEKVPVKREEAPDLEMEREVPWSPVASGTLYRIRAGRSEESGLELYPGERGYRHLRVRIYNEDDRPLKLQRIEADAVVRRLLFPAEAGNAYRLYYGNPGARPPRYDIPRLLPRLTDASVPEVGLGPEESNPNYREEVRKPARSEGHPALIWGALLAVALFMAWWIRSLAAGRKAA